jgi:predicted N-acetyltransferase YhbS
MDPEGAPSSKPGPLEARHDLSAFDCGVPALNSYLKKFALENQRGQGARTYVATRGDRVVGYYNLAAASARREETPARVAKGLAAHPVPVILLARLAVDQTEKGKGLGTDLLRDALLRVIQAADIVGCRAVMVHAKHAEARAFYERFGFQPSATDPLLLFLLMKDIRANLAASPGQPE